MHPLYLEGHGTPRHESGDRAPCNPPFTHQHPLTPATAPGSPAVRYSRSTRTKRNERRRKEERTESAKRNGENKELLEMSGK